MDGEKKKRKMEKEEDKDEDEKMEMFFALIKSTREVHEKLMKGEKKGIQEAYEPKPTSPPAVAANVWNPSFRPEDFMGDAIKQPAVVGSSSTSKQPTSSHDRREDAGPEILIGEVQPPAAAEGKALKGVEKASAAEDPDKDGDNGLDLNLSL